MTTQNTDLKNPLTREHLKAINDALKVLSEAKAATQKAANAGFDVGDRMKEIEAQEAHYRRIKSVYFPGQL